MGAILTASCSNCSYKGDFFVGAGILFDRIEVVKPLFIGIAARKLESLLNQEEHMGFIANQLLAVCDKCNGLSVMPKIALYLKQGGVIEINNPCICGGSLSPVDYKKDDACCPHCKTTLEILENGHWD